MVGGYLDIFVFEELGFAVGPVMDGIDGVIQAYAWCVVADEVYCCQHFEGKSGFKA